MPQIYGLAVDLLEVDADRVEEPEHVRSEGRAAGVAAADPGQPELVADRSQGNPVGDLREQA
jgi:hypothetical protein